MNDHIFLAVVLGHFSYALFVIACMMKNMLYLRLLTILSSVLSAVYLGLYTGEFLWVNLLWEGLFISINVVQVVFLIRNMRQFIFDCPEEGALYDILPPYLSPVQFHQLCRQGKLVRVEAGTVLIEQNQPVSDILLIATGSAAVRVDGTRITSCKAGNLVGEMSFITGNRATATVEAQETTSYFVWDQETFRKLLRSNSEFEWAMELIFSRDLVRKLQGLPS